MSNVRAIDANAAKKALTGWNDNPTDEEIEYTIDGLPTVDAVPVVHGRWEKVKVWKDNPQTTLKCSICKVYQPIYEHDEWLYCPFCGARMDGGAENG